MSSDDFPCDFEALMGQVSTQSFLNDETSLNRTLAFPSRYRQSDETLLDQQLQVPMSSPLAILYQEKDHSNGLKSDLVRLVGKSCPGKTPAKTVME